MAVPQVVEQVVKQLAQQVEDQIDNEIHRLDNLSQNDIEELRQRRILQLKKKKEKASEWIAKGHGEYTELLSEKDFFDSMKGEDQMVCHFYRDNWPCKVIDKHMGILCKQHMECKFVKINAEKSPYLTEKLKIWMLPTIAVIRNEKVVDYVVGFDDLGGKDDFSTNDMAARLHKGGVLDLEDSIVSLKPQVEKRIRKGQYLKSASDEDSDFE